ncbi:efflux RND transporter periplasmic adaptor subunit [Marivirga sp. S37H4]|uniref:Efflux RND transporter periplasmic adaptor subunit n=1 Tax=Marivirga aurantiaca TaxID=2802615 RepID=A0A934X1I1_9BACT|nr:efflux RND transporter periplasmic adaptor subunit [Marivirga aurantiaca]MBK6266600.1 efflux RND transporter periplasmic adaptor subunit [Marivirga aurantiaca]
MNKSGKKLISIIAIIVVLAVIIYFNQSGSNEGAISKPSDTAQSADTRISVDAQVVNFETFEEQLVLTGSLLANESVELASEISGKVDRIYFDEGQYVKKGQILIETNVAELRANLKRLKYTSELNKETEKRQKQLLERGAVSQEEYDIAFTQLKTNEAEIQSLEAQIAKSRISSPFSGYVGLRYISEGSYITPATQIASLYNTNPIKIQFAIPSRYSTVVKQGNEITFTTEASSEERKATVYAIEPQIDPVTRTLTVRAKCPNPDNELIPGQFIRINLTLDSNPETILVPTTAIMPKSEGHQVFTINNGQAFVHDVELGVRTSNRVEILKGIETGDTVVIAGVPQLKDRAEVKIKKLEGGKE